MDPVHPLRAHRLSRGWSMDDVAERLQRLGAMVRDLDDCLAATSDWCWPAIA